MKYRYTLSLIFVFIINFYPCFPGNVYINEFMSANANTLKDEDGDFSDWIELYNSSDDEINLLGYYLSDDIDNPQKWMLPGITIHPKGFILVFASEKDRYISGQLHTNFKISSAGETLLLSNPSGIIIDRIEPVSLSADVSWGRLPDGSSSFSFFINPSPGSSNNANNNSVVKFSHSSGYYTTPFNLAITSSDTVYYTNNGSVPNNKSVLYKAPITLSNRTSQPNSLSTIKTGFNDYIPPEQNVFKANVIRAVAYKNGMPSSKIFTNTYVIDANVHSRFGNPILSLVTDSMNFFSNDTGIYIPGKSWSPNAPKGSGNYLFSGPEWERDINIELFLKDGTPVISQDAGVRMHGASVRKFHQKSLRFYAREDYGNKYFNYPIFPQRDVNQYKRFVIRSAMCDWSKTIFKDLMGQDLVRDLNFDIQNGFPVNVLLNGEFWGIHLLMERSDKYYIASRYNVSPDSVNLLETAAASVVEGSNKDYLAMIDYLKSNDITKPAIFDYIKTQMDIDNYIDYQIAEIYLNNYDWPDNNIKFWKPQKPGSRWRWLLFDLDYAFGQYGADYNMLDHATAADGTAWPNPDRSTFLFRTLLLNADFKTKFISRFDALLNTVFLADNVTKLINKYKDMIASDVPEQVNRWHYPVSVSGWTSNIQTRLLDFAKDRPAYMRQFLTQKFGLEATVKLNITTNNSNYGNILINNAPCSFVNNKFSGAYFKNLPMTIKAVPAEGCRFAGWSGMQGGDSVVINPTQDLSITATFAKNTPIENLFINEIMADNKSVIADNFGEFDDWIELYNAGSDTVSLAGLYITDDFSEPTKYKFPVYELPTTNYELLRIPPKQFKLIWADEQPQQGPLHANIKLSASGEQAGLFQVIEKDTLVIDSVSFPAQNSNKSYGRYPDASANIFFLTQPTPGSSNIYNSVNNQFSILNSQFIISPNPASTNLNLFFSVTSGGNVLINVYDVNGRLVKNLYNKFTAPGMHSLSWDINASRSSPIPGGLYIIRFFSENVFLSTKFIIIK